MSEAPPIKSATYFAAFPATDRRSTEWDELTALMTSVRRMHLYVASIFHQN